MTGKRPGAVVVGVWEVLGLLIWTAGLWGTDTLAQAATVVQFAPQGIESHGYYLVHALEQVGTLELPIERVGSLDETLTVSFRVIGDTAAPGFDFSTVQGSVTFRPGDTERSLPLGILADELSEETEYLEVSLVEVTGTAVLGDATRIRVGILDAGLALRFTGPQPSIVDESAAGVAAPLELSAPGKSVITVDFATRDGTALAGLDYEAVSGTLRFEPGQVRQTIAVPLLNDERREGLESFTVRISNIVGGAWLAGPASATINVVDNDPGAGFEDSQQWVSESQNSVIVNVHRGSDGQAPFTVDYTTEDGTARAGEDYVSVSGTLHFEEGEDSKTLLIQLLPDVLGEGNERFQVQLSNLSGDRDFGRATLSVNIEDNDPGAGFTETEVWVNEANTSVSLGISRGSDDTAPFTVDYQTSIPSFAAAQPGADYVAATGTLQFEEGELSKWLTIELLNDGLREPLESFVVTLSNPSGGRGLDRADATVRIEDNDPGVGFAGNEAWVNEDQPTVTLVVRRGSDAPGVFTVDYATENGSARAGGDYVAASGTLEFGENEETKAFEIELMNDALNEFEETFTVRLSNPSAGQALDLQTTWTTVRIGDNDRGVGFASSWHSHPEESGWIELGVVRQTDDQGPFQVTYETRTTTQGGIPATAGEDYVVTSGVLEFAEGENFKTVSVEIRNDAQREENEEFQVALFSVQGSAIGVFEPMATVVILDNDRGIHFDPPEVRASESQPNAALTVHRGADSRGAFTVDYEVRPISGSGPTEDPPVTGTLAFDEGQLLGALVLTLPGDNAVWEGDQEFEVTLSRPTGVGVLDPDRSMGRVLVTDDETPVKWETHWVGEPFPEVWDLRTVTWGGGRYVAVGGEWAAVSEDGRTWTARRMESLQAWDVIYADGEYLAVGDAGVWRSADGLNWTPLASGPRQNLFRVSHGNGMYVALDREGRAWMTSDLVDWSSEMLGPSLQDLAYGDEGFVVVGYEGKAWHWQPAGEWTALGNIAPNWLGAVAWGEAGYVTASSLYDEQSQQEYLVVFRSTDGRTWQTNRVNVPMSAPNYMTYGDGAYMGMSWNGTVMMHWDGDQWIAESSSGASPYGWGIGIVDLAHGDAGYVGAAYSTVAVSADAMQWERLGLLDLRDIQATGGRLFVEHLIGDGWHGGYFEVRSRVDGAWTLEESGGFWGNPGPGLVSMDGAVGYLRGGTLHFRSQDGTWRVVNLVEQGWLSDIAAGSGAWLVLGRQYDEAAQRDLVVVFRSVDGQNWETSFPAFNGGLDRLLHDGDWFYAMGYEDNVGDVVMQSADGTAWQRSGLSGSYELYSVASGKGMYVAAARAIADDGRVLLRSTDGVNWQVARRFDVVDVWSADVEYGGGLFALTWRGWRGRASPEGVATYLSLDGMDWKRHTPLAGSITALDYADGRLVAAGPAGLVLRSQPLVYLGEPRWDANDSITVWFEGEGGREYTVEGTSDLEAWTDLGTVRPALSAQAITLPVEPVGHRFYRLRGAD